MTVPTAAARLVPLTPEAKLALGGQPELPIAEFPFKAGRESRRADSQRSTLVELRLGTAPQVNDVYLMEPPWSDIFDISREHFAIELVDGQCFLTDRGSVGGTIVAGQRVGGDRAGGRVPLRSGDAIVVGTLQSKYAFRFELLNGHHAAAGAGS